MAEVNAKLMARLGYANYGAQGGDWGAIISVQNALVDKQHCAGIHLNMVVRVPARHRPDAMKGLDADEIKGLGDLGNFQKERPATSRSRHQAQTPRLRAQRLARRPRAWIVENSALERLRWRRREALHQGRATPNGDDLLG